ncbi:MAG: hypothetical protein F2799_07775, partial [Actinobacteria bacterium]|nr:hypothetical protein [Actinomycetota bacterium]
MSPPSREQLLRWIPLAVCGLLAAATMVIAKQVTYDPWSWQVWARQLAFESSVGFDSGGASGWKPLPVIVSIPFNWVGPSAAPLAWVWLARTGMFMIPVVAWRLGIRAAGLPGAVLASLCAAMLPGATVFLGGLTEPVAALFLLLSVEAQVRDRARRSWGAGLLAVLGRPEVMAWVGPYGLWAVWKRKLEWYWFAAGLAGASLLWVGGDWIGTGKPLGLFGKAQVSAEPQRLQAATHPGVEILSHQVVPLAVVICATFAFIASLVWREQVSRTLGAAAITSGLAIAVATEFGYPGVTRYMVPLVPCVFVLAGIGLGRLVGLLSSPPLRRGALVVAGVGVVVLAGPLALERDRADWKWYAAREVRINDLP